MNTLTTANDEKNMATATNNKKARIVMDPKETVRNFLQAISAPLAVVDHSNEIILGVMRNVPHPYDSHVRQNVVIRHADHEFWTNCIDELSNPDKRDRMAVVGTPGIGKSTTAFYLIKLLLERKTTVLYLLCSQSKTHQYVQLNPSSEDNNVEINMFPESTKQTELPTLYDRETYFIVDPGKTKTDCTPEDGARAKVVLAASPDERHWGGSAFSKRTGLSKGGMFRYYPPWSRNELMAGSKELLDTTLTENQISHLFQIFGGIPRQVFAPLDELENREELERKVAALKEQQLKNLVQGHVNVHVGFGVDQPHGGIVVFKPVASTKFFKLELELASDFVLQQVRQRFINGLWNELSVYPTPITWQLLEEYLLEALRGENMYTRRVCVGKSNSAYQQHQQIQLGGCEDKVLVGDCTTAVRRGQDRVLYYSSSRTHPLYDMIFKMGNIYYAFQVTMGKTHEAKQTQIDAMIHDLSIGNAGSGRELHLFYAVHEGVYDDFVTNPVEPPSRPGLQIFHLKMVNR